MLAVKTEDVPSEDGPHFGLDVGLANLAMLSGPDPYDSPCQSVAQT